VKELQRVLITNDVSVKLVAELCKKIEERALKEKPATGFGPREHVVKVVYEELEKVLGGEKYSPKIGKQKILLCGLFGSGKCVHPETVVPLGDGRAQSIESIYNTTKGTVEEFEEGEIKHLETPLDVFSFDPLTLKLARGKATRMWKLHKTDPLVKIGVDAGNHAEIIVTPEHPFFVLEQGAIRQVRADELKIGSHVATPRILPVEEKEYLKELVDAAILDGNYLVHDAENAAMLKQFLTARFSTLRKAYNELGLKIAYCTFTANLKKGITHSETLKKSSAAGFQPNWGENVFLQDQDGWKTIRMPTKFSPGLGEFLGYVFGDGHLEKNYLEVTTEDDETIARLQELSKELFSLTPGVTPERSG